MVVRIIGFLGILLVYGAGLGSNLHVLVDPNVLALVFGMSVGAFLIAGGSSTATCVRTLFSRSADEAELRAGVHALEHSRWGALAGGFLAATAGIVIALANMDNPAALGPGIAMVLHGLLFAITIAQVLLLPQQARLQEKLSMITDKDEVSDGTPLDLLLVGAGLLFTILTFGILSSI